jgi:putative transposase
MLGFKSFDSAASVLAGLELVNMIRKSQFTPGRCSFQQFIQLAV